MAFKSAEADQLATAQEKGYLTEYTAKRSACLAATWQQNPECPEPIRQWVVDNEMWKLFERPEGSDLFYPIPVPEFVPPDTPSEWMRPCPYNLNNFPIRLADNEPFCTFEVAHFRYGLKIMVDQNWDGGALGFTLGTLVDPILPVGKLSTDDKEGITTDDDLDPTIPKPTPNYIPAPPPGYPSPSSWIPKHRKGVDDFGYRRSNQWISWVRESEPWPPLSSRLVSSITQQPDSTPPAITTTSLDLLAIPPADVEDWVSSITERMLEITTSESTAQ